MQGGDCGKRDVGWGLLGKGCGEGTVGKGMQGGDCGKRDVGSGMWGGTVGKGVNGGDCGEKGEGRGLWGMGFREGDDLNQTTLSLFYNKVKLTALVT